MTSFLYLPSTRTARATRRVDLANIGSLFAEAEEPVAPADAQAALRRVATLSLLLLLVLGDTLLMSRPQALAACLFKPSSTTNTAA